MTNYSEECDKKKFKPPVSWLMGRELLAGLKWIAGYTFMGDKQDAKDWMSTAPIQAPRSNNNSMDAYWFDYIADTGDGMSAVYTIAYLCMSDLWLNDKPGASPETAIALDEDAEYSAKLPRGEFLFIGGDTAYHIADTASLRERFQMPFNCACLDIMGSGKAVDQRPIYGIPANHDYYDALDGFNRQFCKPIADDDHNPMAEDTDRKFPQLGLLGFERTQTASYLALELPFGWTFWGLDTQEGKLDKRQQAFFVSTYAPDLLKNSELFNKNKKEQIYQTLKERSPDKLIVATPEPSTVFGRWAKPPKANGTEEADGMLKSFKQLGLELSFTQELSGNLPQNKCRLDLSGDIHHYERYWGGGGNDIKPANYASVVAGGGGAFLHPSHTDLGEVRREKIYPERKDSHQLITSKILNPYNIFRGGFIWLAGAVIALFSYFAVTVPDSTWALFKLFPDFLRPLKTHPNADQNLLAAIQKALSVTPDPGFCSSEYCFNFFYQLLYIVMLGIWVWRWKKSSSLRELAVKQTGPAWTGTLIQYMLAAMPGFLLLLIFIFNDRPQQPNTFMAGLLIDLCVIIAALLFTLSRIFSDILIDRSRYLPETWIEIIPLWVFGVLGVIYAAFGFLRYGIYPASVMTFDLLIALIWLFGTFGLIGYAAMTGACLLDLKGKLKFGLLGFWHSILQLSVPVCLILYADWTRIIVITGAAYAATFLAGRLFTLANLVKDFQPEVQNKLAKLLLAAWIIVGVGVIAASAWGQPVAVDGWRLLGAFILGALFSCIWFGWYLAVALAFNGHNNEAGGGARSEQYRHLIRFKLEENRLTGYVIGFDEPVGDFSDKTKPLPKFRLVDIFTIQAKS